MSYVHHRTELECETKCETCFTLIRRQNIGGGLPTLECRNGTCDMTGGTEFCDATEERKSGRFNNNERRTELEDEKRYET
jgi:hypothetical protein